MLDNLIKELTKLQEEINAINIDQIPEDQRVTTIVALTDKVLNTLDNAELPLPEEHSDDSGIKIPTSEF
jgi:hypothetical protein